MGKGFDANLKVADDARLKIRGCGVQRLYCRCLFRVLNLSPDLATG